MAGVGLLFQHRLDQSTESMKAAAEIGEPRSDPDPRACLQIHHRNRLPSTACTSAGSTPLSTLTNARPGNSMWIEPEGAASGASSGVITLSGSLVTITGKSSVRDWLAAQPTPFAVLVAPLEDLVGVHSVFTRYTRDRCARHQCRFHDPPLLLRRAIHSLRPATIHTNSNRLAHKAIVSHACAYVYTAIPGRLLSNNSGDSAGEGFRGGFMFTS